MKNKKQMVLVGLAVLVTLFLVIGVGIKIHDSKTNDSDRGETSFSTQEEESEQLQDESTIDTCQEDEELEQVEEESANKMDEENIDSDQTADDSRNENSDLPVKESSVYIDMENVKETNGDRSDLEKEEEKGITFPYTIPNTELVVNKISDYKGIYVEDGLDTEVQSVSAMLITNVGNTPIEYAEITVKNVNEQWLFKVSTLPSGASAIVQEANGGAYQEFEPLSLQAECAEIESFEMSAEQVNVEETEDGSLRVSNLTNKDIPCVRVFYKFYMQEEDVYVGGITYVSKITDLKANSSCDVNAKHYMPGNSKIMMVRTYDTY